MPWFDIKNQSQDVTDIYIYDVIGVGWDGSGVSAEVLVKELSALKASTIRVYINSPGGLAHEGVAIYNALVRHPAKVETYVDGLAASIASIVALAGDTVTMADNALMMIHDPWVMAVGGVKDFEQMIQYLKTTKESLLNTYEKKSAFTRDELAAMMESETWFSAQEAMDAGFVSAIAQPVKIAAHWKPTALRFSKTPPVVSAFLDNKTDIPLLSDDREGEAVYSKRCRDLDLAEAGV